MTQIISKKKKGKLFFQLLYLSEKLLYTLTSFTQSEMHREFEIIYKIRDADSSHSFNNSIISKKAKKKKKKKGILFLCLQYLH